MKVLNFNKKLKNQKNVKCMLCIFNFIKIILCLRNIIIHLCDRENCNSINIQKSSPFKLNDWKVRLTEVEFKHEKHTN